MIRLAALVAMVAAGCVAARRAPPVSPLEARYRLAARRVGPATSVGVYRALLRPGLFSRCRMLPHDSLLFALRAPRCGEPRAAVLAAARLLLEVEASPALLRPVLHDGRVVWFDLPAEGSCGL